MQYFKNLSLIHRFYSLSTDTKSSLFSFCSKKNSPSHYALCKSMMSRHVFDYIDPNERSSSELINFNRTYPSSINAALSGIAYINDRMKKEKTERIEINDWKYVSMVIDRLLLWIFTSACFLGTFGILLQAPSIYDERKSLGKK